MVRTTNAALGALVGEVVLAQTDGVAAGLFSTQPMEALRQMANVAMAAPAALAAEVGLPAAQEASGADVVEAGAGAPQARARRVYNIARIDVMTAFADAWASFADENAAVPKMLAVVTRNVRAWVITAVVAGFDVMLAGYWLAGRTGRRRKARRAADARVG